MALKLVLRDGAWHARGTIKRLDGVSVRVRESTRCRANNKRGAQAKLNDIVRLKMMETGLPMKEKPKDNTVADMNRRYLNRPEGFLSPTPKYMFKKFDDVFGKRDVESVKIEEIYKFFEQPNVKPTTIRRHMTDLIASINFSKERGLPCLIFHDRTGREIGLVKPPEGEGRLRWLSEKERDRLIDCCDDAIKPLVMFLFYTGARLSNAFEITDKDIMHGEITLYTRKGRSKKTVLRKIPIANAIEPMLQARCMRGGLLFPNPLGNVWKASGVNNDGRKTDNTNFYNFWYDACEKAGIEDFKPHDCRHTFASLLMQKGANLIEIQKLLGHASLEMVTRYAHLAPSGLESVIERFGVKEDTSVTKVSREDVVLSERIELSTSSLPMRCSTTELRQHSKDCIETSKSDVKKGSGSLTKDVSRHLSTTKTTKPP